MTIVTRDKNGTPIKAGNILFNSHDEDRYHHVIQDMTGKLYLGDYDSPLERYGTEKFWEIVKS
jgi:hypothetical protein